MSPPPKRYLACSVPRFLRQDRLRYLSLQSLIGSRIQRGDKGNNLIFDIVMLPADQFQRMKLNVGLPLVLNLELKREREFPIGFVPSDTKQIVVPADEPDPEAFARDYFKKAFGLVEALNQDTATQEEETIGALFHSYEETLLARRRKERHDLAL